MFNKLFNGIFKSNGSINISNSTVSSGRNISISSGDNVCVKNNRVYINGKEVENFDDYKEKEIKITLNGNVCGGLEAGNFLTINGDINGNVDAGNMCEFKSSTIGGDIDCGNMCNITADTIEGSLDCGNMCNVTTKRK